jgi:hypothetical protein
MRKVSVSEMEIPKGILYTRRPLGFINAMVYTI